MNEYTKNHNKSAAEYSLPIYKTALLLQIY